jgi:rhamnulokinase
LIAMGRASPPLRALVDPDDPSLAEFGDMPARIRSLCERSGQKPPATDGELVRCILESLALKYQIVLEALEALTGPVSTIHVVGGGVQNWLLCQFTADATGRRVVAGPVEATAAGNAMVQAMAQGQVGGLPDIRAVLAASFRPTVYEPLHREAWAEALGRFRGIIERGADATGRAPPR